MKKNETVSFIHPLIPNSTVAENASLFVLGGVVNNTEERFTITATLYARASGDWRSILSQTIDLAPQEHRHLYYNVPANFFQAEEWGLQEIDEVEILISSERPAVEARGALVFVAGES